MTSAARALIVFAVIATLGQGQIFRELEDQFPPQAIEKLALADFDGDGDVDAFSFGNPSYLLVNDGNTRFVAQQTPAPVAASGEPALEPVNSLIFAVADLNGDGLPDLVTGSGGLFPWWWMRVWINQGNWAFAQMATFPAPSPPNLCAFPEPRAIVPADVDGDGDLDLVVSIWCTIWGPQPLELFLNSGNGTFVNATNQLPSLAVLANEVFVRDLDNDGDLDVFVTDNNLGGQPSCWPGLVAVQRVLWNNGSGSFSAPQTVPGPTSFNPRTALADLNGDGLPDLVYAATCPNVLAVSMNLGAGAFGPLATSPGPVAIGLLTCNVNGGSNEEVVLLTTTGITVHTGSASGLSAPIQSLPYGAELGQVVDVEGDGDLDLVITFHGRNALLLNAQGTLVPIAASLWGQLSDDQAMLGDVNGDGAPDYVAVSSTGLASALSVSLNDGTGTFVPAPAVCAGGACPPMGGAPTPVCGFVLPKTVFPVDANGDGLLDLYTTDGPPFGAPCGAAPVQPDQLYLNTGGAWSLALTVPAGQTTGIQSGDLNGDGRPDLVIGRGSVGQNLVVFNLGAQGWSNPLILPQHATSDLAVFDIDGDGDLDILQAGSPLRLLINDGTGGFTPAPTSAMGLPTGAMTVVAGDLDGDGDQDVILSSVVWLNFWGSTFASFGPLPSNVGKPQLFDADADGDLDAGAAPTYWPFVLSLMFNNGAGQFGGVQSITMGGVGGTFVAGDLDRDGDVDLIVPGPRVLTNVTRQISKASIVRPGYVASLELHGPPGGAWALYASTGTAALEVPPIGTVLLDLSGLQAFGAGTFPPSGGATISTLLPPSPALLGLTTYLQALVGPPAHVTNLEVVTVHGL